MSAWKGEREKGETKLELRETLPETAAAAAESSLLCQRKREEKKERKEATLFFSRSQMEQVN